MLTKKGRKIKAAMTEQYGKEKGTQVFYAAENKGSISGVAKAKPHKGSAKVKPRTQQKGR